jgi:DNA-directed RNA polymerase subunit RPC12/RpoP
MLKEYACKNCGYTLLLDEIAIKDYEMQCPSCNTKFVGIIVLYTDDVSGEQEQKK